MIVSRNWLKDYVDLPMPLDELTERLTLTGLNLEGVEELADDNVAIDLEVTSNRPDCLGHVGVAREVSVIWQQQLKQPNPQPKATGEDVAKAASIAIDCPDLCPRYTARVIRGVKIGPSPEWLANHLRAIGVAVINNVVDITNFVMMECGQPLHAFDLAKLSGSKIIVRKATAGEDFTAIDHKTYKLSGEEVVIADADRPVALGGVMGGAETEVSEATVDVLIESADFEQLAVRGAARRHVLHSPSSYRFERGVDPEGIDWASRRCCELILELAGGTLCEGVLDLASPAKEAPEVTLRYAQVPRLLGVHIPADQIITILTDLGCEEVEANEVDVTVRPPSWRADLTREADLLEEVARIYGYDQIPEDAGVRVAPSRRSREEIVIDKVRGVLAAAGVDEAVTLSAVQPEWIDLFQPWAEGSASPAPLMTGTAVLRRANCLRQSVVPSLLACRRTNETASNSVIELFEIAKVYLPVPSQLPAERRVLAITSGGGYLELKGVIEGLIETVAPGAKLGVSDTSHAMLDAARSCEFTLAGKPFGVLGEVTADGLRSFELRGGTTVAELDLAPLIEAAALVPTASPLSAYPPVTRDVNLVVDESLRWSAIDTIVRKEGGQLLESVTFQDDSFRDPKQLGEGKKSVLFTLQLRKADGTLTSQEADDVRDKILAVLAKQVGGELRS